MTSLPRTLIGTSTKAYLTAGQGREWGPTVLSRLTDAGVDPGSTYICPSFPLITLLQDSFGAAGGLVGAQDVSVHPPGAFTGEVSAALLAGLGVRLVMAGHPERRRLFGETDAVVRAKVAATAAAGMAPVVVVGEAVEGTSAATAIKQQVDAVIGDTECPGGLVVAYEPAWAIGREQPAPAGHIADAIATVRDLTAGYGDDVRVLYGGSAQQGTFSDIAAAAGGDPLALPDGVFLGRAGVDPHSFAAVATEVWDARSHLVV